VKRAVARALLCAAAALAGCSRGSSLEGACKSDGDCPPGWVCVRASGVCERATGSLDAATATDSGVDLAAPDQSPPSDGAPGDAGG
jgi:hypothetical protein